MTSAQPTQLVIRAAQPHDIADIFALIQALAEYEKLSHQVTGNADLLKQHLFGDRFAQPPSADRPCIEAIVAEVDGRSVGFALFFTSYSTFLTKPGLYLEDLFVLPEYRGQGVGKALLSHLAKLVRERDYGRLEWSVLDWNASAIGFYERMGATVLPDWRICRVTGEAIGRLADED